MTPDAGAVRALLAEVGVAGAHELTPLPQGRNNRVYRVETATRPFVLKWYFCHPGDSRDRLSAEVAFARYAVDLGLRAPRPLAVDSAGRLALWERLPGRAVTATDVDAGAIDQAMTFLAGLDRGRDTAAARALPAAAEACFDRDAHVATVERRLEALSGVAGAGVIGEAAAFIQHELMPRGRALVAECRRDPPEAPLAPEDRVLSPSDFGFHNALLEERAGTLRFLDFEYAGWDDPAKTACDFFCQVEVPVPLVHWERFVSPWPRAMTRARLLLPLYRLKWCAILLNDFLPTGAARRAFSARAAPTSAELRAQLEKAHRALQDLAEVGR